MNEAPDVIVADAEGGLRLDVLLRARFPGWSRRRIARAFDDGRVRVDGRPAKKGQVVAPAMRISVAGPPDTPENLVPLPEETGLAPIHEDASLVAISKPAGMPSHPLRAGERGTAANALAFSHPECTTASTDPREAGLCHRLDTGTSGVLLAARNAEAHRLVRDAFRRGEIDKSYLALVAGDPGSRTLRGPIHDLGMPAETSVEIVERCGAWSLVRCTTRGGQRHQVRVHLAEAGFPLAGDDRYGGPRLEGLAGFFLHAESLRLRHPTTGEALEIRAPLPGDRAALLDQLRSTSDRGATAP